MLIAIAARVGLRRDELLRLTPAEFASWVTARNRELRRERYLIAWQTAILVNPHVRGRITPAQLLGIEDRRRRNGVTMRDPAEIQAELELIRTEWQRREAIAAERSARRGDH